MRRILVDHARAKLSNKRGGGAAKVTFDDALLVVDDPRHDFVALDDALEALAKFDERKSRVIELRFFGGLSVEETASVLKVGPDTVMRDWRLAKAWLQAEMARIGQMTPERWARIEELYHAAHAKPPAERAAFLTAACPDDDALRRRVSHCSARPSG